MLPVGEGLLVPMRLPVDRGSGAATMVGSQPLRVPDPAVAGSSLKGFSKVVDVRENWCKMSGSLR